MKDRIAKSVFWLFWSRGVIQVVSFASTLVVVRIISPSDYGLMALASVWTGVLLMITEFGLSAAIVQFRELMPSELNFCFWSTMCISFAAYAGLFAAAPFIATWFDSPPLEAILRVVALVMPLYAVHLVPDGLLRKLLEFDKVSYAEMISSTVTIPVVFLMAWYGFGVWALVAGSLTKPIVRGLVIFWFVDWRPGLTIKGGRLTEILRFSIASFGSRALWAVYEQSDVFVLGKVSGGQVLGYFSMAKELAHLPVTRVSAVVNQIMVPVMAELQMNPSAMRASLLRVIRLVASILIPVFLGLAVFASDLVKVILGDKWLPTASMLQVICFSALIKGVDNFLPPVLRARYRASFLVKYNAILLFVMLPAFIIGALWAGGVGVAVAWVTAYPLVMSWMAREVLRELELEWKDLWERLRSLLGAAILMGLVMVSIREFTPHNDILRLVVGIISGAVTYGLTLWLFGRKIVEELCEVTLWIFRPSRMIVSR